MKLPDMLIMVVAVALTGIGIASFAHELGDPWGTTPDTGFNSTYDHILEVSATTETMRQKVESGTFVSVEGFVALFNGAISVMKLALSAVTLPFQIFSQIITDLGLPYWSIVGLNTILVIVVVFTIIYAVIGAGKP